jgi:hypothetical protein
MRAIPFILLALVIFSCCDSSKSTIISQDKLIAYISQRFIEHDSLYRYSLVSIELLPYQYYKLEFIEDSLLVPPPSSNYSWKNEELLIKDINLDDYFGDSASKKHLKYQITNSEKFIASLNLEKLNPKILGLQFKDSSRFYVLYPPLFNIDSSAAYIQYDHFDNGYEEGNGAIFIIQENEWTFLRHIWGYQS